VLRVLHLAASPDDILVDLVLTRSVAVFPAGKRLLTFGHSSGPVVWSAATGAAVCTLRRDPAPVPFAVIFPDGQRVATGCLHDNRALIWDVPSCSPLHTLESGAGDSLLGLAVLERGALLATLHSSGLAVVWSASLGIRLKTLRHTGRGHTRMFIGFATSVRGDALVAASWFGATIWNATSGRLTQRLRPPDFLDSLALSPGGDTLVTCSGDEATLWDVASGRLLRTLSSTEPGEPAGPERGSSCSVAVGLANILDGFGRGLPWGALL